MTFPPTDTPRRFSIIPRPPGEVDEDAATNLFSREQLAESARKVQAAEQNVRFVPEVLHHFDPPPGFEVVPPEGVTLPVEHPAYGAFPGGVIPDMRGRIVTQPIEAEPTAVHRWQERQAEREARRNAQGFDWGVDEDAPRERQWRALDLSVMFIIAVFIIIDMLGVVTQPLSIFSAGLAFGTLCGLLVFRAGWARYDIGVQLKDLLLELRLLREES